MKLENRLTEKIKNKNAGITYSLDLGSGENPSNPFACHEVWGIDICQFNNKKIICADLAVEEIPFESDYFDYITAFDFIEHIPRIIYNPQRRFCFIELMNEIYRVLKPGGTFLSHTPAFPKPQAWQDPTHVNIITAETFPLYFDDEHRHAKIYGFKGYFKIIEQRWNDEGTHLITRMIKSAPQL